MMMTMMSLMPRSCEDLRVCGYRHQSLGALSRCQVNSLWVKCRRGALMGLHLVQLCLLLDLGNQDKTIGTLRSKDDNGSENAA